MAGKWAALLYFYGILTNEHVTGVSLKPQGVVSDCGKTQNKCKFNSWDGDGSLRSHTGIITGLDTEE